MSWNKRVDNTARVFRKVPQDVFGKDLLNRSYKILSGCKICKTMKPLSEFYVRTDRSEDDPNAVYGACIPCYDERAKNGSSKEKRRREANTLELFLESNDDE